MDIRHDETPRDAGHVARHLARGLAGPRALLGLPGRGQLQARDAAPVRGRDLELRLPRGRHPQQGRLPHQPGRRDAGHRGARRRRRDQLLREPLRPSRRADRLRRRRQRPEQLQVHLSRLELRPLRQPARHRLRARHQRPGRHAQGFPARRPSARASSGPRRCAAWSSRPCRPTRRRSRSISAARCWAASSACSTGRSG